MKTLTKILSIIIMISLIAGCQNKATQTKKADKKKIGIILPLEHQALNEIVAGLTQALPTYYDHPVEIKVMNAQGDQNMQRAIIQQMQDQNYDAIVPVATGPTQMTIAMIRNKPIISLAGEFTDQDRHSLKPCNVVVVHDEIPQDKLLAFFHAAYPQIKNLVLIHSTSDKIFPEVKNAVAAGKKLGIDVKPIMVATLPEMVSATQALPPDTQGIFILKDNLIASGVATLAKTAANNHIPLFTSDQGTVEAGAGFSLGVQEKNIGAEGAKLVAAVIMGKEVCELANVEMTKLTVFANKKALEAEQQNFSNIVTAAQQLHYPIETVNKEVQ